MKLEYKITDIKVTKGFEELANNILQVAAQRGLEEMVERLPARGEGPYSTGRLRESARMEKTGNLQYTYYVQMPYATFVEFGTGPRGQMTGAWPEFPNDPQPGIHYHEGEVLVTRFRGRFLEVPYIRHTQGMDAQPFIRPGLIYAMEQLIVLWKKVH